ncbi:hypothetical protein ELH43_36635 [Rhizobium ruizarguesonis]|uniref:hypothetical protein n=1 Tax=Rhizobium ruizarguesonis TaxID=2081791 RepID=UPI00102F83F0|nr:hypothetical protein [Rhizobium ruizarguesonis]TBB60670.1 hypothetical protein ELH43_36635 [Rhizobium ruizarguesonis]
MTVLGLLTSCAQPAAANAYDPDPITLRDLRADARDEADLAVQESMATWAAWMTALTAVTTVGTGISIYFIYRSFQQTGRALAEAQKTNIIAQKTSFIENRPWIMINGPSFQAFYDQKTETSARVEIRGRFSIINIGRLPAQKLGYEILLSRDEEALKAMATSPPATLLGGGITVPANMNYELTVNKQYLTLESGPDGKPDVRLIHFLIKVGYLDSSHDERLLTVGHGVMGVRVGSDPDAFTPIVFERIRDGNAGATGVFAYTLQHMS